MKRQTKYINDKSVKAIGSEWSENDMQFNNDDLVLLESLDDYMKARLDIEEIKRDPAYLKTAESVKAMMADYSKNRSFKTENVKFIKDILSDGASDEILINEIGSIKKEIENSKLAEITAEWVKEWHENKQRNGGKNPETEASRKFITSAISHADVEKEVVASTKPGKIYSKSRFIRYASLAAAALIGVMIIIRSLLPSYDPDKLYKTFYEPMKAISPVTRSINDFGSGSFAEAIDSYKSGDYERSVAAFSQIVLKDPTIVSSRFYLGLSQLALNNYDEAVTQLSNVVNEKSEYGKDAQWYLGLACLKSGDIRKASECFENLAESSSFYRERSEKILRRLK